MIVPCYNEAAVLDAFYREMSGMMARCDAYRFELLFVNDGSRDDTQRIIESLAEKDPRVKYISFSRNFGKESAMLAGLRHASGDFVGFIDADLQHSPDLIPEMLAAVDEEGYDVAACRRVDRKGEAGLKSLLSASFYKVANRISEIEIDDGAQDYRIMRRAVADAILSMPEHDRFTKGIFSWVGFNTKWFPHENRERAAGETKWSIRKLMLYAVDGILGYTVTPLRLPLYAGIATLAAGLVYALIFIIRICVQGHSFAYGSRVCLIALLVIGGMLLLSVGVVGSYLARIYNEAKARPQYLVAKTNITNGGNHG